MPAKLNRRIVRETADSVYEKGADRKIIVQLEPGGAVFSLRLKGQRTSYNLTYKEMYILAMRQKIVSDKLAKERSER